MMPRRKSSEIKNWQCAIEAEHRANAQHARLEDESAAAFWAAQRQAQGYAASQIFGPTQTERDAAAENAIRNPVRDRIVVLPKEILESM
jgi:hypothetical protein